MARHNTSGPFTDLWALGIIIYQMLTGDLPWNAKNEADLFDQIMNNKIEYPEDMPKGAVDLISKLLKSNPLERIGYGSREDNMDYEALKNHEFFNGLDFIKLKNGELSP